MGPDPPVRLPGAVRPERSAVQERYWFLPVLVAGLYRAQELDAVDPGPQRPDGRSGVFYPWRNQSGPSALAHLVRGHRTWLRAAGPLLRSEGLVLCVGPVLAALQRQRRRGWGGLR